MWEGYIFAWVGVDGSQLAVFVAFHGGLGCENLVYLFIFKHLWVLAITSNEDIVKQLKEVSTLC